MLRASRRWFVVLAVAFGIWTTTSPSTLSAAGGVAVVVDAFSLLYLPSSRIIPRRRSSNPVGNSDNVDRYFGRRSIAVPWLVAVPSQTKAPLQGSQTDGNDSDNDDGDDDIWDSDFDLEEKFFDDLEKGKSIDPALSWNVPEPQDEDGTDLKKLGIDIGRMLDPLTETEAEELKAAATEIINDAIAEGIDEIENLRQKMKREFDRKRKEVQMESESKAKRESDKLLSKIDKLTNDFLTDTKLSRKATKLAAAADRESEGKGVEVGVWGTVDGASVTTGLLGSVDAARLRQKKTTAGSGSKGAVGLSGIALADLSPAEEADASSVGEAEVTGPPSIVIVADTQQDDHAKRLVPPFTEELERAIPGVQVTVYKPSATLPLGGDDADCAILFATSLSDKSTVYNACDRLLRKTLRPSGGGVGKPPTQLVLISTVGTERTDKMPYTMQNLMGGGKLEKRRQMEEAIVRVVQDRYDANPPLDYTICKFGSEIKTSGETSPFQLMPGDCLDGNTAVDTAVTVLKEAIAFQPAARNSTLCCVGSMSDVDVKNLDDWFLRLDGPEVMRQTLSKGDAIKDYDQLVEYLSGWGEMLAESGKGLTTPVRAEMTMTPESNLPKGVVRQDSVRLLFLPTATGKNYLSREEEKALEKDRSSGSTPKRSLSALLKKEGGIEVVIEVLDASDKIRVRAKRCNYGNDAVIKELSEETILKRLQGAIDTWLKDRRT